MTPTTLRDIRDERSRALYPTDLLGQADSALLLFAAGMHGANDGIWIHDAKIPHVTAVDLDGDKLATMAKLYGTNNGWKFIDADVYAWVSWERNAADRAVYDLVSVDPQISQAGQCLDWLPAWCSLAHQTVVLGIMQTQVDEHDLYSLNYALTPRGWYCDRVTRRNDTAHWAVFRKQGASATRPALRAAAEASALPVVLPFDGPPSDPPQVAEVRAG